MPNTEVKLVFAHNTRTAASREDRLSPAEPDDGATVSAMNTAATLYLRRGY